MSLSIRFFAGTRVCRETQPAFSQHHGTIPGSRGPLITRCSSLHSSRRRHTSMTLPPDGDRRFGDLA